MSILSYFQRPQALHSILDEKHEVESSVDTEPSPASSPSEGKSQVSDESGKKKKRKRYWKDTWMYERPWLMRTDNGKGMYCLYCDRFAESSKVKWTKTLPCTLLTLDAVKTHAESESHRKNTELHASSPETILVEMNASQLSEMQTALRVKFNQIYYLAKTEKSVHNGFKPLHTLLKKIGIPNLEMENKSNVNYTSMRFIDEVLRCITDTIVANTLAELGKQYFSILVDETTDIAADKQLIIYIRYQASGQAVTRMIGLKKVEKTDAETITSIVVQFLNEKKIDINKMVCFCSDGASNMTGVHNGVGAKLKEENPHIVTFHCMAHRLALVAITALKKVPIVASYCDFLNTLVTYVHRSPLRLSAFEKCQTELGIKNRRLIRPAATRWLSFDDACYSFHSVFPAVVLFFKRE